MAKSRSFSSLLNQQSKSINFNCGHFPAKYQGYSLTFWPEITYFHHFSICNQNQTISVVLMFCQNTKVIALLFSQTRSFSSLLNLLSNSMNFTCGHFPAKYTGYSFTFWPEITYFHHFSICNQTQSISFVLMFCQNTKVIALPFGQKSLIFITFQSAIKLNEFYLWSFSGKIHRL